METPHATPALLGYARMCIELERLEIAGDERKYDAQLNHMDIHWYRIMSKEDRNDTKSDTFEALISLIKEGKI